MLVEPREWALILPARTRYETRGGGTETTTEREIIFSPEIQGPRPGQAQGLGVVVGFLEILRDAAEVEQEVKLLLVLGVADVEGV